MAQRPETVSFVVRGVGKEAIREVLDEKEIRASVGRAVHEALIGKLKSAGISERQLGSLSGLVRVRCRDADTLDRAFDAVHAAFPGAILRREPGRLGVTCTGAGVLDAQTASNRLHLENAPSGIGTPPTPGSRVPFADVELGWEMTAGALSHVNLERLEIDLRTSGAAMEQEDHGTKAVGVVLAQLTEGGIGYEGIARAAPRVVLISAKRALTADEAADLEMDAGTVVPDVPQAVLGAALALGAGGVVLIEVGFGGGAAPVEQQELVRDSVSVAAGLGVTVVAAAGNGGADLDEHAVLRRGHEKFDDSRAIVVAAGSPKEIPAVGYSVWGQSELTNHGSRIDCFAPDDVLTTVMNGTVSEAGCFGDTSAAAAVVAGAAVATQGLALDVLGRALSPGELRWLLSAYATPGLPGLGRMPDFDRIQRWIRGTPDVAVRDTVLDEGAPHLGVGRTFASPDILLFKEALKTPGEELQVESPAGALDAGAGATVAYVRVRNRTEVSAEDVHCQLFWDAPTTLPTAWKNRVKLVGSLSSIDTVAETGHGDALVFGPFALPADLGVGPGCLLARITATGDEAPPREFLGTIDAHRHYVQAENNLAWRCGGEVRSADAFVLTCEVRAAADRDATFTLEACVSLPASARVTVTFPEDLAQALHVFGTASVDGVSLALHAGHADWRPLGDGELKAGDSFPVRIDVTVPPAASLTRRNTIALRQVMDGIEVGRFTWRLSRPQ